MRRLGRRLFTLFFSLIYLTGQVALGHAAEANMWSERRRAMAPRAPQPTLAQLPATMSPAMNAIRQIPMKSQRLTRPNEAPPTAINPVSPALRELMAALPAGNVRVVDTWAPDGGAAKDPVVILQDVHLNGEAQANLAAALAAMTAQGRIGFVGIEGAFGAFNFSPFRAFPMTADLRALFARLLGAGQIAAPSFVGITASGTSAVFAGVDDEKAYAKNVRAYLAAEANRPTVEKALTQATGAWRRDRSKLLSPMLARFSERRGAFQDGSLALLGYARFLNELGAAPGDAISRYLEACRLEAELDWTRVERERNEALTRLTEKISPAEVKGLIAEAVAFREGRLGLAEFYRRLSSRFKTAGVSIAALPAFQSYLEYALLADTVKPETVLAGLGAWEAATVDRLGPTDAERELLRIDAYLSLVAKLTAFALAPEDWDRYRRGAPTLQDVGTAPAKALAASLRPLASMLKPFEDFYAEADRRTDAMADRLAHAPAGGKAIVVGGFHTPALHARLVAAGIPHVIAMPRITRIDLGSATAYLSIFQREKESVSRLFAGRQLFLSPAMIAGIGTGQPVSLAHEQNVLGQEAVASAPRGGNVAGYDVAPRPDGTAGVDNDARDVHLEVNPAALTSRTRNAVAASLLDRAARAALGAGTSAYRVFTGWIAPVFETPVFGLAFGATFSLLQLAGATAFLPGSALILSAIAITIAHAGMNRDWRLSSMAWWTVGGLIIVSPFAFLPAFPALMVSAALHVAWNQSYLRGWFGVPMSLFGYKPPDLSTLVAALLENKRSMVFTDASDAVDAALFAEAQAQPRKTPYLRVVLRDESDLERLKTRFIAHADGSYETPAGPLFDILSKGGILFIDYAGSDPKLVEGLNSLFDSVPYFDGKEVSPNLQIVGALPPRDVKSYPVSYYSRFRRKMTLKDTFPDPVDVIPWTTGEAGIEPAELDESPMAREILLGTYSLGKDGGVVFNAGKLQAALKSGVLIIRGGDWTNPVLRDLIRQLIVKRTVEVNGETITVPETFRILRQQGDYGRRPVNVDKIHSPNELTSPLPVFVVNDETRDQLFSITETSENGTLIQSPGLLSRPEVRLRITDRLPAWVWHRILHAKNTKIILEVDPGVPIPAEYQKLRSETLVGSREFSPPTLPLSELKNRPAILIRAADSDFAESEIARTFPGRTIERIAISPGDQYDDLVSVIDVKTREGGRRTFTATEGPVLKALRAGKVVVLDEASANPALIKRLQTALLDDGYLPTYNPGEPGGDETNRGAPGWIRMSDLPGKLVIVTRAPDGTAASVPFAELAPTDNQLADALARRLDRRALAEGRAIPFSRADFERVMSLRDVFRKAVSSGLLKQAPRFNLSRLEMLFDYDGDWLKAFNQIMIEEQSDNPEGAAFMRTMVRLTFKRDDPGRTPNSFANNKLTAALNALYHGAPFDLIVWRLADALSLDALTDPAYGLNIGTDSPAPPAGIVQLAGRALVLANTGEKAAYYRSFFAVPEQTAGATPALDTKTDVGQISEENKEIQVLDLLKRFNVVFLRGPPGTGKSSMADRVAERLGDKEGPFTVGPDVTQGEILSRRKFDNGQTTFEPGRIWNWIEKGGVLIIDEANLMLPDFWNFISKYVDERHRVIFTGNQESLPGRSAQRFILDHAVTITFDDFDDAKLRKSFDAAIAGTSKRQPADLSRLLFDMFSLFRKTAKDRSFSMRDVQEMTARTKVLIPANWTPDEVVGMIWRLYSGTFTPTERLALRHLIRQEFGVNIKALQDEKRKEMLAQYGEIFRKAGLVPVGTALDTVAVVDDFLRMRAARLKGDSLEQGKRGLIIEGPSGRGKDVVLDPLFENAGIKKNGAGTSRYDRVTASLNFDALTAVITNAQRNGSVDIVSELNLLPSALLEGRLNDVLTGKAAEGFAFVATINSSEFSGRETLSSALQNRVVYRREADYPQDELQQIAEAEAVRLGATLAEVKDALTLVVNAHVWMRDKAGDARFTPTTRDLVEAVKEVVSSHASPAQALDVVKTIYGPLFLDQLLKTDLPSADSLAAYKEGLPIDPFEALRVIGQTQINRPDIPFDVQPDAGEPDQSGGYYRADQNMVGIHTEGLLGPEKDWINTFFHEVSHGLFTRRLPNTPSGDDPLWPLQQGLEDVRHQAAFRRFFPASHLNPTSELEAQLMTALFSYDRLRQWMKDNSISPRLLFHYTIVAVGKGLITREMLEKSVAIMKMADDPNVSEPMSASLENVSRALEIADAIPDAGNLTEDEIRFRQFQALTRIQAMRDSYLRLTTDVQERKEPPTDNAQDARAELAIEKIRASEPEPDFEAPPAPPAITIPTDEEIARLQAAAAARKGNARTEEQKALVAKLSDMERDVRTPGIPAQWLTAILSQLTDVGDPRSLKPRLERSDDATRRRAQRLLDAVQSLIANKPLPASALDRVFGPVIRISATFYGQIRNAMPIARSNAVRVLLATFAVTLAIGAVVVSVQTGLHLQILAGLQLLIFSDPGVLILGILGWAVLTTLLVFVFSRLFPGLYRSVADPSSAGARSKYTNVVAHQPGMNANARPRRVPPLRPQAPPTWTAHTASDVLNRISGERATDLDEALSDFVARRLQASRVYGREGTLDPIRLISDPVNAFLRSGGVEERVKKQVVVTIRDRTELSKVAEAALAYLTGAGFTVRLIQESELTDELISELAKKGPVDAIRATDLQDRVDPVYFYGAMSAALDGKRLNGSPKEVVAVETNQPANQVRQLVDDILRGDGMIDPVDRSEAMVVSGDGPFARVELTLNEDKMIFIEDLGPLKPLAPYLTVLDLEKVRIARVTDLLEFPHLRIVRLPADVNKADVAKVILLHPSGLEMRITVGGRPFTFSSIDQKIVNPYLLQGSLSPAVQARYAEESIRQSSVSPRAGEPVSLRDGSIDFRSTALRNLIQLSNLKWLRRLTLGEFHPLSGNPGLQALTEVPNLEYLSIEGDVAQQDIDMLLALHPNRHRLEIHVQPVGATSENGGRIWRIDSRTGEIASTDVEQEAREAGALLGDASTTANPPVSLRMNRLVIRSRFEDLHRFGFWPSLSELTLTNWCPNLLNLQRFDGIRKLTLEAGANSLDDLPSLPWLEEVRVNSPLSPDRLESIVGRHPNPRFRLIDSNGREMTKALLPAVYRPGFQSDPSNPLTIEEQMDEAERHIEATGRYGTSGATRKGDGFELTVNGEDFSGLERLTDLTELTARESVRSLNPLAGLPKLEKLTLANFNTDFDFSALRHLTDIYLPSNPGPIISQLLATHPNAANLTFHFGNAAPITYRDIPPAVLDHVAASQTERFAKRALESQESMLNDMIRDRSPADASKDGFIREAGMIGAHVSFPDLSGIERITSLQFLTVDAPIAILRPLEKLPNLQDLILTQPTEISFLKDVPNLKSVRLGFNLSLRQLRDLLENHPNNELAIYVPGRTKPYTLRNIRVAGRSAAEQMTMLLTEPGVTDVRMEMAPGQSLIVTMSGEDTGPLEGFDAIGKVIFLGVPKIDPSGLATLPNLKEVVLTNSPINLHSLERLASLELVTINNSSLPDEVSIAEFLLTHPNRGKLVIEAPRLGYRMTADTLPGDLKNIDLPMSIYLASQQVEDIRDLLRTRGGGQVTEREGTILVSMRSSDLSGLEDMDHIVEIQVNNGQGHVDFSPVKNLPHLGMIALSDTDFDLDDLLEVPSLKTLVLHGTSIRDEQELREFISRRPNREEFKVVLPTKILSFNLARTSGMKSAVTEFDEAAARQAVVQDQVLAVRRLISQRDPDDNRLSDVYFDGKKFGVTANFANLSGFEALSELTDLTVFGENPDLSPLRNLEHLRSIDLASRYRAEQLLQLSHLEVIRLPYWADLNVMKTVLSRHPNRSRLQVIVRGDQGSAETRLFLIDTKPARKVPAIATAAEQRDALTAMGRDRARDGNGTILAIGDPIQADIRFSDLSGFEAITKLEGLRIENELGIDLSPLLNLPELTEIGFSSPILLTQLIRFPKLTTIRLSYDPDDDEVKELLENHPNPDLNILVHVGNRFKAINRMTLEETADHRNLKPTAGEAQDIAIEQAALADTIIEESWADPRRAPADEEVTVTGSGKLMIKAIVNDLSRFGELTLLSSLDISGSSEVEDLSPLQDNPNLTRLNIVGTQAYNSIELLNIRNLSHLTVDSSVLNYDFLVGLSFHPNAAHLTVDDETGKVYEIPKQPASVTVAPDDLHFLWQMFDDIVDRGRTLAAVRKRFSDEGRLAAFEALLAKVEKQDPVHDIQVGSKGPVGEIGSFIDDLSGLPARSRPAVPSGQTATAQEELIGRDVATFSVDQSKSRRRLLFSLLGGRARADMRLRDFADSPAGIAFSLAVERNDFDRSGLLESAASTAKGASGGRAPDAEEVFDDLFEVASRNKSSASLDETMKSASAIQRPLVFVTRGPEDDAKAKEALRLRAAAGLKEPAIIVGASEVSGSDGRVSLSRLDAYLRGKLPDRKRDGRSESGLAGTFLLLPQGVAFNPDIDAETLRSILIATLDELLMVRPLEGQTVDNILRVARVIATNA